MENVEKVEQFKKLQGALHGACISSGTLLETVAFELLKDKYPTHIVIERNLKYLEFLQLCNDNTQYLCKNIKIKLPPQIVEQSGRLTNTVQVDAAIIDANTINLVDIKSSGMDNNPTPEGVLLKFRNYVNALKQDVNKTVQLSFIKYKGDLNNTTILHLARNNFPTYDFATYFDLTYAVVDAVKADRHLELIKNSMFKSKYGFSEIQFNLIVSLFEQK